MTANTFDAGQTVSPHLVDTHDLTALGYDQELHRKLGPFASFAAGFSFVSILTTVFQLFAFGYSFGGPAFVWTWPVVFVGQLCVALVFAELAAEYPLAGCIFQWSRRLGGAVVGWFAGWFMLIGYIVSVAAIAIALQSVLPEVWSGFQLVGGDPSLSSTSGATNAIILGTILIGVATVISAIGVHVMAKINAIGICCEIVGVLALIVLLFAHSKRGPSVVTDTAGTAGSGSYLWPLLTSSLMAAYVMYGFDSAAELSEETRDPRRTTPPAIVRALVVSGIGGALLLMAALMASPDLRSTRMSTEGMSYIVTSTLGSGLGKVLLVSVAIAVISACLAIQNSASRVLFSMAREGVLPWSRFLNRVGPRTGTPIVTGVAVGLLAAAMLLVNLGQAQVFTAVTSVAVVVVYLAYLFVTIPMLVRKVRDRRETKGHGLRSGEPAAARGHFSMGRAGLPVTAVAVLFGLFMTVNVAWPRAAVYDPAGGHWYLRYFSLLFLAGAVVLGGLAYLRYRRVPGRILELSPGVPSGTPAQA
jgi:urea carboxylase system permease